MAAAVQAALKPLACQMSSFEAKMNNLTGEVEELKVQDCANEEKEYDDMAAAATTFCGAGKTNECERAGPSQKINK